MKTTREKKNKTLRTIGAREVLETIVAALIFGSVVAVVVYPVADSVGPWIA